VTPDKNNPPASGQDPEENKATQFKSVHNMHRFSSWILLIYWIVAIGLLFALITYGDALTHLAKLGDTIVDTVQAITQLFNSS